MIDHCDSSVLRPLAVDGEARRIIALRDKSWAELKLLPVPTLSAVSILRLQNDAAVRTLAAKSLFPPDRTQVELLLCKVCEMFCARCEIELEAETRRPGNLTMDFVRRSFEMALADEELPPGHL